MASRSARLPRLPRAGSDRAWHRSVRAVARSRRPRSCRSSAAATHTTDRPRKGNTVSRVCPRHEQPLWVRAVLPVIPSCMSGRALAGRRGGISGSGWRRDLSRACGIGAQLAHATQTSKPNDRSAMPPARVPRSRVARWRHEADHTQPREQGSRTANRYRAPMARAGIERTLLGMLGQLSVVGPRTVERGSPRPHRRCATSASDFSTVRSAPRSFSS